MPEVTNQEYVAFLRHLAGIYEAHPGLKLPYQGTDSVWNVYVHDKADAPALVKALGAGTKKDDDMPGCSGIIFTPECAGNVRFQVYIFKSNICRRKVVGTKHVAEIVVPATKRCVIPAHDEDIVEWDCTPLLDEEVHDGDTK